ncbi:EamA family transporter [Clostridium sp. MCC353]|uniref:DMT family transporter n=1 Tax=Clostridium sp. MCC353 TaxID=2592646 RepID=UPI001C02D814|nr:DMT family transporter [Clostridium sp. MCC353]MBT9775943.1 EamA family transporter [Clostridium sp. MCC353]
MKAKLKNITAMLIFGSIGLFVKSIHLSSSEIALARGVIGTAVLLTAGFLLKYKISVQALKRNFWLLTASGAAIGFNWICLFEAYKYTTISTATLCYYLAPVFVAALSPFLLKEKLTLSKGLCIALSLIGMALVADVSGGYEQSPDNMVGILFGISAAVLYAGVVLINKFFKGITAMESTTAQLGVASAVLLPYVLLTENLSAVTVEPGSAAMLAVVGVVHTGFAYLIYFSSVSELKGQTVALFSYIDPITAILLSALVLGEKMNLLQAAGAVLILGSTLFGEVAGNRRRTIRMEL